MDRRKHLLLVITLAFTASSSPLAQKASSGAAKPLFGLGTVVENVNFEGLAPGTNVSQVFSNKGSGPIEIHAINPAFGPGTNAAVIFDSSNPTGEDFDLGTPNEDFGGPGIGVGGEAGSPFENKRRLRNLIIVAEDLFDGNGDGLIDDPDDADLVGALIELDFAAIAPVTVRSMSIIDVEGEEATPMVEFRDENGGVLSVQDLPIPGDNGVAQALTNVSGVFSMSIVLNGSGAVDNVVFSQDAKGEIGDTVFCDNNDDGVQDPGDPGIEGVTVDLVCAGPDGLLGTADDLIDSTQTDANGNYLFNDLPAGLCSVTVDPTTVPGGKLPGKCPAEFAVDLAAGQSFLDADFCFVNPGSIGDTVFCDNDNDGVQDPGDPGIAGVTVHLTCEGEDGILGTADDFVDAQVTDADGMYLFSGLAAGECLVEVDLATVPDDKLGGQCPTTFLVGLAAGQAFLDADFCFINPASIGDTVFCDTNDDGDQDPGEPGIAGVTINLLCAGPDGVLGTADDITDTTSTDGDGKYLFEGLPPGECIVTVDTTTAPADKLVGQCPTQVTVDLAAGQAFLDADFCFVNTASIGDFVWCDLDDDGVQDPGEPGIEGVTVDLTCAGDDGVLGTADDLVDSMVTDADGLYLFTGLPAGVCEVSVDATTAPADKVVGQCPTTVAVPLAAGEAFLDADFCFIFPGAIGDTVFCDIDNDGVQDGDEPRIEGVTVDLTCAGPDGALGTADDLLLSQTTDADGHYLFENLAPGACSVAVDLTTAPSDKVVGKCPTEFDVNLGVGESFLDADFCFITPGEIGDTVFCDLDNDGVQDPEDPGIAGVEITLVCAGLDGVIGTADDLTESTTTDGDGHYLFSGVFPDLCEVSVDTDGPATEDKILGQCPVSFVVELEAGESFLDADFCFITPGEIGDTVFCDIDFDGFQDAGEPGIAGVTVDLVCAGPDGAFGTGDDLVLSQVTDADGMYLFTEVPAGDCVVSVDVTTAGDKVPGSCPVEFEVALAAGDSFLDADFCFVTPPGTIGDTVFCDLDDDGVQDPGEPGIEGAIVDLVCAGIDGVLGTADDLTDSMVTDADGMYLFTEVPAGLCEVSVDVDSAPPGKIVGNCPTELMVDLPAAGEFLDADFCFKYPPPGTIGDTVFCDTDDDGVQDPGEPGIAGVTVDLSCAGFDGVFGTADDFSDSQVTDANGHYLFEDVPPGMCDVTVDVSTAPIDKVPGQCPTTFAVDLQSGQAFLDADFCFVFPPGEIGDTVFCDLDNDGVQDPGEPGIEGATVELTCAGPDGVLGTADDTTDSQVTDANGNYLFTEVPKGDCLVAVDPTTVGDKKVGECPIELLVDLQPGQSYLDADFCFVSPAEIGDTVFCDLDDDGVLDAGEPGIEGVTVNLTCAGPDGVLGTADDFTASQVTDANGNYLFEDLDPAPCRVEVDVTTVDSDKAPGSCPTELTVGLAPGESFLDADFCFVSCSPCDGKVTFLELTYLGDAPANVVVEQKKPSDLVIFDGLVAPGESFSFFGADSKGTMSTEIKIFVDGVLAEEIHTSCSQPIGPGLVFGDFLVEQASSKNGGPICPLGNDLCIDGKPSCLSLVYTGEDCSATDHSQDSGKVECAGDPMGLSPVQIVVYNDDDIFFDGLVEIGEVFNAEAANAGEDDFKSATFVDVYDLSGNLLQAVEFHTSCSQDLFAGDQFGSIQVDSLCSPGGGEPGNDACVNGKPQALTMSYTGDGCDATSHTQDAGKVNCSGDPNDEELVHVIAFEGSHVFFDGLVGLGETFEIDALLAGETTLKSKTFVEISDTNGNPLQSLEFHTSCSQDLFLGDQFGALRLDGFTPKP